MNRLLWYINRLKKMSITEVSWRIGLELRTFVERRTVMGSRIDEELLFRLKYKATAPWSLKVNNDVMAIGNPELLFGYISSKDVDWHDAFHHERRWPIEPSVDMVYKNLENMGDARITWELNRHYDFQILAKNYALTGENQYLTSLVGRLDSFVKNNPFLMGINYVSEMELAIRALSWYITYELLPVEIDTKHLRNRLKIGVLNMMCHVQLHHSRYSSANNHLLVEMAVLGIVGISFGIEDWVKLSLKIMPEEMINQNHIDGVNKEQSIHYQCFVMEAVGLWMLRLKEARIPWDPKLNKIMDAMAKHIADLMDVKGHIPQLGDDDGGKLLDFYGVDFNHYEYVLQMTGILLKKHYLPNYTSGVNEHIYGLIDEDEVDNFMASSEFETYERKSVVYEEGGHSILRYTEEDKEILCTLDHAPLGFGAIAAHGHADALHMTLRVDGIPIMIDPGTYLYHGDIEWRNYFRRTANHNTVAIDDTDQSEMQGAFLWGKRAEIVELSYELDMKRDRVESAHNGYSNLTHRRAIEFDKPSLMMVTDSLIAKNQAVEYDYCLTYVLDSQCRVEDIDDETLLITTSGLSVILQVQSEDRSVEMVYMSDKFGEKYETTAVRYRGSTKGDKIIKSKIRLFDKSERVSVYEN